MILLGAVAGAGAALGVWLVVVGLRPGPPSRLGAWDALELVRRWPRRLDGRRLGHAALGGLAAALVVRWPIAVAAGALLGWFVPLRGERAVRARNEAKTEALAQWCEMLRDAAGTARGIEGILVAAAASAPGPIRRETARMARRLEHEPLVQVLEGLADDLAHPIGDLLVTALQVAATAGSRRIASVLDDLAAAAHHEASMRRRVDVARARPRSTMRLVATIVAAFVAGMIVFAREYLAPYGTMAGQLVLLVIGLYWGLGFWWMGRLGRLPSVERYLDIESRQPVEAAP